MTESKPGVKRPVASEVGDEQSQDPKAPLDFRRMTKVLQESDRLINRLPELRDKALAQNDLINRKFKLVRELTTFEKTSDLRPPVEYKRRFDTMLKRGHQAIKVSEDITAICEAYLAEVRDYISQCQVTFTEPGPPTDFVRSLTQSFDGFIRSFEDYKQKASDFRDSIIRLLEPIEHIENWPNQVHAILALIWHANGDREMIDQMASDCVTEGMISQSQADQIVSAVIAVPPGEVV